MSGGWGWGWGWAILAAAGGTQFEDAFWESGAAAALGDHTPDVDNSGNGWTENMGDTQVGDELGYATPSEDDAVHLASCDVGLADCTVQVKVKYEPNGGDIELGLVVRGDDAMNNYWQVTLNPSNSLLEIVKIEEGQARSVETSTGITNDFQDNTQYTVKAVCSDARITAYCILGETEDSVYNEEEWNNTETRHGIIGWHNTAIDIQEFDDFTIEV